LKSARKLSRLEVKTGGIPGKRKSKLGNRPPWRDEGRKRGRFGALDTKRENPELETHK